MERKKDYSFEEFEYYCAQVHSQNRGVCIKIIKAKSILIISTFPPKHCGIGSYAQEHVLTMKKKGWRVYTQSFADGSSAHFNFPNNSILGITKLLFSALFGRFDQVYMHFSNGVIWPRSNKNLLHEVVLKMFQYFWLASLALFYSNRFTLLGHEIVTSQKRRRFQKKIESFVFSLFKNIEVHTDSEKRKILEYFGERLNESNIKTIEHHSNMQARFHESQDKAREELGIESDKIIILCIGYVQPNKSFDLAIHAMKGVNEGERQLYIVGSVRNFDEQTLAYQNELVRLAALNPAVSFVNQHLEDIEFDKWIVAADVVVLPYSEIFSSGVGARAHILKTPLLVRTNENLISQFMNSSIQSEFFSSLEELSAKMQAVKRKNSKTENNGIRDLENKKAKNDQNLAIAKTKKILFVMPCFGEKVRGGAEAFVFSLSSQLAKRGFDITVWASDSSRVVGRNHELDSISEANLSFKVRRFRANAKSERLFSVAHRFMNRGGFIARLLGPLWTRLNLHGLGMEKAFLNEGKNFDVIHLFHYLLGSAHRLSGIFPQKTLLHPFLHDEAPAYQPIMRHLFAGVHMVSVASEAELKLGEKTTAGLLPLATRAIGIGVEPSVNLKPLGGQIQKFIEDKKYIIYIGHLTPYKNVPLLINWHERLAQEDTEAPYLVMLGGDAALKLSHEEKIVHLSWQSKEELTFLLKNARALVQLSLLESFSQVIIEAFLEKIPVIVHADCLATKYHIDQSKAGFSVRSYTEYRTALAQLDSQVLRASMGEKGFEYARRNYSWDQVCQNYADLIVTTSNHQ